MLEEEGVCDCAKDLTALVRLRNLLVHRYWVINDDQIYNAIKSNFRAVEG
ncbi:MAG: HepT-like ribonuclease domain-containing protein, partial [Candidatus Norongarragalinales archaeon]